LSEARIALAMVNVLVAIPRTPLFARLLSEGRLDNGGEMADFGTISTNVLPKRISRRALCDGYLELMQELYTTDSYFGRLDAMYLYGEPTSPSGRTRYLRRHPWLRLKSVMWSAVEVTAVFALLMRGIPCAELRRDYRRRLWNVVRQRPQIGLLRVYVIKCALHFHFDRLITQMVAERATLSIEENSGAPRPQLTKLPVITPSA
jgi:Domain of unknown function (DUF4070)